MNGLVCLVRKAPPHTAPVPSCKYGPSISQVNREQLEVTATDQVTKAWVMDGRTGG